MRAPLPPVPRAWQFLWLAGFALLLCAPAIGWLLRVAPPTVTDGRELAPWPDATQTPLTAWPAKFEAWLRDHYPLRGHIVRAHAVVRHRWLRAPAPNVLVGRDDWLFYTGNQTLEDLAGRDRFSPAELDRWADALAGRRAWLRARGIAHLFVLVPNKSTIYPEFLPDALRAHAKPGKLDQLLDHLRARGFGDEVLDLRPALLARKSSERIYWMGDSHWNAQGLIAATAAILARLALLGVDASAADWRNSLAVETVPRLGDNIDLLALRGLWPQPPEAQVRINRPTDLVDAPTPLSALAPWHEAPWWKKPVVTERASARGRAVLLCDSFFRAGGVPTESLGQMPFQLCFRRFTSLWEWASPEMIRTVAEQEKPDVIIEAWTERFLKVIPPDHPDFARAHAEAAKK